MRADALWPQLSCRNFEIFEINISRMMIQPSKVGVWMVFSFTQMLIDVASQLLLFNILRKPQCCKKDEYFMMLL